MRRIASMLVVGLLVHLGAVSAQANPNAKSGATGPKVRRSAKAAAAAEGQPAQESRIIKPTRQKIIVPADTSQRVDSQHPLAVILVVDQSKSNEKLLKGQERTKALAIADSANLTLESLLAHAQDGEDEETGQPKFKPYFMVGGVGYSTGVRSLFGESGNKLLTLDELFSAGLLNNENNRYEWVQAAASGYTHMGEGLNAAQRLVRDFITRYPDSHPPVVIHVTDGRPERGMLDPLHEALQLQALKTSKGNTVVLNFHFDENQGEPLLFPKSVDSAHPDSRAFARLLYKMSSPLPKSMAQLAMKRFDGLKISPGSRGLVMNADGLMLPTLFEIGTVQAQNVGE